MKKLLLFFLLGTTFILKAQISDKEYEIKLALSNFEKKIIKAKNEKSLDSIQAEINKIDTIGVGKFFKSESKVTFEYIDMVRNIINPKYAEQRRVEAEKIIIKKYGKKLGEKIFFQHLEPGMTWEMMNDSMSASFIELSSHTQSKNSRGNWDVYIYKSGTSTYYTITLLNLKIIDFNETYIK